MAKSGSLPKSLDFPTIRFLSGRKDLPLGRARVQPAAARVVSRCMSRMRIRDRVVRVDQWLISSKASTFNSSTRRCGLVFRSSKRCAPASFFPAQSDAFFEQISTVVLLTFGLAFLALASRILGGMISLKMPQRAFLSISSLPHFQSQAARFSTF